MGPLSQEIITEYKSILINENLYLIEKCQITFKRACSMKCKSFVENNMK